MAAAARSPEALLPRSDSKNPATTCRGITATGRPCRRALASSPHASPSPSPTRGLGVVAILDEEHAGAFFCYHHKDQAEQLVAKNRQRTSLHPLKERSSLDTLAERVGVLDIDEEVPDPQRKHRHRHRKDGLQTKRRDTLPIGWNEMQSPLMSVPDNMVQHRPRPSRSDHKQGSNLKISWSCCLQAESDDDSEPSPRTLNRPQKTSVHANQYVPQPEMQAMSHSNPPITPTRPSTSPAPPSRPSARPSPSHSQTQNFLSLIPSSLSPQTTSRLLSELSRPISPADDTGYIYIFWLTPESENSAPDDETASSLLDEDDDGEENEYGGLYPSLHPTRAQKKNKTLQRYASVRHASAFPTNRAQVTASRQQKPQPQEQRTILLKIGRAANVHRRMSQWTKQCGQNITLIRYYPYTSSNPKAHALSTSNSLIAGRKVPHVHRVERLVHLELEEKRVVKPDCQACGREHREWFEIEANRDGLKNVDEVVRRWVEWAERL